MINGKWKIVKWSPSAKVQNDGQITNITNPYEIMKRQTRKEETKDRSIYENAKLNKDKEVEAFIHKNKTK